MADPSVLSALGSALGAIGKCLVDPVARQFNYLFCFNNNIQDLETQLESLKATRDGVQLGVTQARNNVRIIGPDVEAWLTKANDNTEEAETIIKDKAEVSKGCFNGWCPNLKLRYSVSRKAVKKTQDLVRLRDEGINYTKSSFSPRPPCQDPPIPTTQFQGLDSRTLVMNKIIEALKDDGINLIGVCGMGGIGKTTMANEVAKRVKEENLFNEVPITVVSQEPDLNEVQICIAETLGLKLDDKKSRIARASLLRRRLLQDDKKILVMLDDIWEEFDLQEQGFPLGGNANKGVCKILFTSRFQNMWRGIQNKSYIQLEVLLKEEAWHLFKEKAGNCVEDPNLLPLAKEIVDECGGLPLALVTMGSALVNERNQYHWNDALRQLRTPCSESISLGVSAKVYQALDFSYKFLKDECAKKLFLLCCLFPEDYDIPVEDLFRYAIGLQLFETIDKVGEARDRMHVLVDQLKSCSLLLDYDKGNYFSVQMNNRVKIHDVVRDVAISIASRDKHGLMTIDSAKSREWPKKATYEHYTSIFVILKEITKFPEGLRCPKLELLVLLFQYGNSAKIPSNFFEGMGTLKVLGLAGGGRGNLLLASSLQFLRNLQTLCLDNCYQFDDTSVIGELVNLEILSFRDSEIKELPEEIRKLVNLRLLDMTNCKDLERIPPGVLSALDQLQELYMRGCNNFNWEGEGKEKGKNASLREFESLSNLNTLEIHIKNAVLLPGIPLFSKLTKYVILLGYNYGFRLYNKEIKRFHKSLSVDPEDTFTILPKCSGINSLLRSTQILELERKGLEVVHELIQEGVRGLQQLVHLSISNCDTTLEYLANTVDWVPRTSNTTVVFPILESLKLSFLPNLRKICHGQLPSGSFGKLKDLYITYCDRMEEVIWKEKGEEDDATTTNKIEFPNLESMTFLSLPSLEGFCRGIDEIEFPQLKKLRLTTLPKVKWLLPNNSNSSSDSVENHNAAFLSLFPHKVAFPSLEELNLEHLDNLEGLGRNPISVGSFFKLRKVNVQHCGKLLCVFPSQLLTMLRNLEALIVEDCDLLEKVFELEMTDSRKQESEMLSPLKSLQLRRLPQLNNISKRGLIGFMYTPQLSILCVHDCDNLRYLFPHSAMKSILQLQKLEIIGCTMMSRIVGEENGQGKSLVDYKIEFSQLKILRLYSLPNLVSFFPKVISTVAASIEHLQNPGQSLFNEKVAFPSLEQLHLHEIQNMNEIWCSNPQIDSFYKLIELHVSNCDSLQNLFSPYMARYLVHLQRLVIDKCSMMEEVVAKEENEEERKDRTTILPKLNYLELTYLPVLKYFCHFNHDWELPLVDDVRVGYCLEMKTFSPGVICTPELHRVSVIHKHGRHPRNFWMGDLNQTILNVNKMQQVLQQLELQEEEEDEEEEEEEVHEAGKEEGETNDDEDDDDDQEEEEEHEVGKEEGETNDDEDDDDDQEEEEEEHEVGKEEGETNDDEDDDDDHHDNDDDGGGSGGGGDLGNKKDGKSQN